MLIPPPQVWSHFHPIQDHQNCAGDELGASAFGTLVVILQSKLNWRYYTQEGEGFFGFFFLFSIVSPPPKLFQRICWQQPLSGSGARRALGSSSAEGIGLQEQKSLHTGSLLLFCHVASGPRMLPVPCATAGDTGGTWHCWWPCCSMQEITEDPVHGHCQRCLWGVCFFF